MEQVNKPSWVFGLLRIAFGWMFLWAFIDKLWGLGFATAGNRSWLSGASPTSGYLSYGTKGPLAEMFAAMANTPMVDWLFMLGLLFVGLTLVLGIMTHLGIIAAISMLALFYLAGSIWPQNNPFLDEHIIYIITLIGLWKLNAGDVWGLGSWWSRTQLASTHKLFR